MEGSALEALERRVADLETALAITVMAGGFHPNTEEVRRAFYKGKRLIPVVVSNSETISVMVEVAP